MIKEQYEVDICNVYWRNAANTETLMFMHDNFDHEEFKDYLLCFLTANGRTNKIGYKIYEENGKMILQLIDVKYEIKTLIRREPLYTLILVHPSGQEIVYAGYHKAQV